VTRSASRAVAVGPVDSDDAAGSEGTSEIETVRAIVLHPDGRLERVHLTGADADRFAEMKLLLAARSIISTTVDDQDGPAALAWLDEFADRKGLARNDTLSGLLERTVNGPAVITGFGLGERCSMTSVHLGLERVLEQRSTTGPEV
jgi:hypothetical protein